ncbi:hypothetical protein HNV12_02600 [Methanococcoides sp. SA1]|nr:hypothetical protein [Methanococcoides sp. SA1]
MKEEIYVSITPSMYRQNKSNILLSQADLLQSMKKLQNLRILSVQKHELKKELKKLMSSMLLQTKSLKDKMPKLKIPKKMISHERDSVGQKAPSAKKMEIDEELSTIREKLRELNS